MWMKKTKANTMSCDNKLRSYTVVPWYWLIFAHSEICRRRRLWFVREEATFLKNVNLKNRTNNKKTVRSLGLFVVQQPRIRQNPLIFKATRTTALSIFLRANVFTFSAGTEIYQYQLEATRSRSPSQYRRLLTFAVAVVVLAVTLPVLSITVWVLACGAACVVKNVLSARRGRLTIIKSIHFTFGIELPKLVPIYC